MKLRYAACLIGFIGLFTFPGAGWGADDTPKVAPGLEKIPEVVARVDGRPIRRRDLILELVGSAAPGALRRIVQRTLVEQEAIKRNIMVTNEELDAQVALDRHQLPNDMQLVPRAPWDLGKSSFEKMIMTRYQMDLQTYKMQVVRQRILVKKIIGQNIKPTLPQLRAFYLKRKSLFQPNAVYRAAHILITPLSPNDLYRGTSFKSAAGRQADIFADHQRHIKWSRDHGVDMTKAQLPEIGPEWENSKLKAMQCLRELRESRLTWDQAVKKYTQDPHDRKNVQGRSLRDRLDTPLRPGEVGSFTKDGPMVKEFYEGAKNIPLGKIGGPIRTKFGYHIVWMMEKKIPNTLTFEAMRDRIERIYVDWIIRANSAIWLNEWVQDAALESTRAKIWPLKEGASAEEKQNDPIIGKINNQPLRRSAVWQELYRSDGSAALDRLINREMALGPLKNMGPALLQWVGQPSKYRVGGRPALIPITVTPEELDLDLNSDRLALDVLNTHHEKENPKYKIRKLNDYIYDRFGQSRKQYERSLTAATVLRKAIKRMVKMDEPTLRMQWALAKKRYRTPTSFDISHLLIELSSTASSGDLRVGRKMAADIHSQILQNPSSWFEITEKLSDDESTKGDGGHLGWLYPTSKGYPGLYKTLLKTNVEKGQISDPIRTSKGFHIIRVDQRRAPRDPDFEEIKGRLERDYLHARASMFMDVWLRSMNRQSKIQRYIFDITPLLPPERDLLPED